MSIFTNFIRSGSTIFIGLAQKVTKPQISCANVGVSPKKEIKPGDSISSLSLLGVTARAMAQSVDPLWVGGQHYSSWSQVSDTSRMQELACVTAKSRCACSYGTACGASWRYESRCGARRRLVAVASLLAAWPRDKDKNHTGNSTTECDNRTLHPPAHLHV